MLAVLVAPQPSQLPEWHHGTLPQKVTPLDRDPWHSGTVRAGSKAAILTFAWPSIRVSRLLALNVLHWAREKEWKKVRSDASAAQLLEGQCSGDRAEIRETLTAWRRLSSFSRSLTEGSRVTRALFAPSGCLCTGRDRGRMSPKPPLLSPAKGIPNPPGYHPGAKQRAELPAELLPATCSALLPHLPLPAAEEEEAFHPRSSPACPRAAHSRGGTSPQLENCVPPYGCA